MWSNTSLAQNSSSPTYHSPPSALNIRTMAEWEEIEALVIAWKNFPYIHSQIIKHAQKECKVIVLCENANSVILHLNAFGIDTANVELIEGLYNTVWIRDYGATNAYGNHVDSLYLVDWIYNRPRPFDDKVPKIISEYLNLPLFSTANQPYDLVHTGGNFMTDGQGTGFASKLVIEENGPNGVYNNTIRTEAGIDSIMKSFMGINRFIKTEMLPYNSINHIDMYMKLLNEETLLVGEYPTGVADGPQIETNIQYIQNNFKSVFGSPYKIVRIPMPPDTCGNYPDYTGPSCTSLGSSSYIGHYRTFVNLVFVNKTVLVPIYSWQYDTTALRILRQKLPGYKVVGIDCDEIIKNGGALHCITRAIGVKDPLLIVHQPFSEDTVISDQGLAILAKIQHRAFIQTASVMYRTDTTQTFTSLPMTNYSGDYWRGILPQQPAGTTIQYYIKAKSFSNKEQVRPITAPNGFWTFKVGVSTSTHEEKKDTNVYFAQVYPNPAGDKLFIPVELKEVQEVDMMIYNVQGQLVERIFTGILPAGTSLLNVNVSTLQIGTYFVVLQTNSAKVTQTLVIGK
jgi:agmatine deiminase